MPFVIDAYPIDMASKCKELGLAMPQQVAIIPSNLSTANTANELEYETAGKTLIKILAENNIQTTYLSSEDHGKLYLHRKAAEIVLPAILITLNQLSQNPAIATVTLNVLSNFVYDCLRGFASSKKAKFEIVIEQEESRSYRRVTFEGSGHDLKDNAEEINSIIRELTRK